jgi:terminase large subunit-like protein
MHVRLGQTSGGKVSGGGGSERLARSFLKRARAIQVPTMPDKDAEIPTPLEFARMCGFEPDPWQLKVLESTGRKLLLCCSRQSGKSTTTAIKALREAVYVPGSLILLISPSQRQSGELFRKVLHLHKSVEADMPRIIGESALRMELDNGSRIIALPASESTVRGYSAVTLVVVDEAARVADDMIASLRPTLATTNGQLIALTTPRGKRGWFYEQWTTGEGWERTEVAAKDCPRIKPEWLAEERRDMGEFKYVQEYENAWLDAETSVFASALIEAALSPLCKPLWPVAA